MKKGWGGVGTHRLQALQYGVDAFGRRGDCSLLLARALVVQLFAERGLVDGAVEGESLQGLQHGGRVTSLGGGLHNNTASWPRTGGVRWRVRRSARRGALALAGARVLMRRVLLLLVFSPLFSLTRRSSAGAGRVKKKCGSEAEEEEEEKRD